MRQQQRKFINQIVDRLSPAAALGLGGVCPGSRPWLAASLAAALTAREGSGGLLWILADERRAEQACAAARFYMGTQGDDPADPFAPELAPFPLHQLSPYDDLSPDRDAMAERLALLFRLVQNAPPGLIIASAPALMRLTPPAQVIDSASLLLLRGQELDQAELARQLVRAGYLNVPLVEEPGGFSVRGFIVDIYTPQLAQPVRLEWFGDEVESIRVFDAQTQRTVAKLSEVYVGPAREILQDPESNARAIAAVEARAAEQDLASHKFLLHRRKLQDGLRYFGIEALLPAFCPDLTSLFDLLPADTAVLLDDPGAIAQSARSSWERVSAAFDDTVAAGDLAFPPASMLMPPEDLEACWSRFSCLTTGLSDDDREDPLHLDCQPLPAFRKRIQKVAVDGDPLLPLTEALKDWHRRGMQTVVAAARPGRARQLMRMLQERGLSVRDEQVPFDPAWLAQHTPSLFARIASGDLQEGFICEAAGLAVLPDAEVFGRPARKARPAKPSREVMALEPGSLVVHTDFGVAKFEGLVKLAVGGSEVDFLYLSFRDGDKLYLPVTRMKLVERYAAAEDIPPPLTKLGGKSWERTKNRIQQVLLEMADELVRLEAERRARPGQAFAGPSEEYRSLCASFPFAETRDQRHAIKEVLADMTRDRAMDRLICGDVGFGKTEVAIRAAYLASLSGTQTLVLVPTTLLALQHLTTFRNRLENAGAQVEMLSRMTPKAEQKPILNRLAAGQIDVLIGTHSLLAEDVHPKSLGLLIIDEEHRFGVRHKEKLKSLKTNVDVLTMTATPLPRTMQMSLTGLRDISVIRTPPPGRRSIRTFITRFSQRRIAEAIERERARGGQVFYVHNFVKSLDATRRFLAQAVPDARLAVAHGQMSPKVLEKVMTDFVRREVDVLVCTSIIESGLDIPSANTIIVNRADRFGLAQLYQIRGRVGRSADRAYAYFLIPGLESITKNARKRLEALADNAELGAGYQIASRDLEIRGAGNLLGKAQSGHIKAVGYELYSQLLERALMEARGQVSQDGPEPELKLPVPGFFPEDYVASVDLRLDLYARLSRAENEEAVYDLEQEIADRCGPLPPEALNLIELSALKTHLRRIRSTCLEIRSGAIQVHLDTGGNFDPKPLVQLASEQSERISLDPSGFVRIELDPEQRADPMPVARSVVARMVALMKK